MPVRKLVLHRETIEELTAVDLAAVAAGARAADTHQCPDCTYYCITGDAICGGLSRRFC